MKKELGSLVCKALTRQLAENGQDVAATVVNNNVASHALFRRIGYRAVKPILHYSYAKPMEI
jgi:RimJ/RimL family protein N-acetyltransferase